MSFEAEATERRRHFPRIVERADRAVVGVNETSMLFTRRSGPHATERAEAVYRRDARTETARDVQPVDAFSKNASPPAMVSSLRQSSAVFNRRDGHEMPEHHVADRVFGQQAPQAGAHSGL